MLIVYNPVFESSKWDEPDNQPRLCVGQAGNFLLTLTTKDFDIVYKDGKAEVTLGRHMSSEELKAFAMKLLEAANAEIRNHAEWVQANEAGAFPDPDDTCPTCDGNGTVQGK